MSQKCENVNQVGALANPGIQKQLTTEKKLIKNWNQCQVETRPNICFHVHGINKRNTNSSLENRYEIVTKEEEINWWGTLKKDS